MSKKIFVLIGQARFIYLVAFTLALIFSDPVWALSEEELKALNQASSVAQVVGGDPVFSQENLAKLDAEQIAQLPLPAMKILSKLSFYAISQLDPEIWFAALMGLEANSLKWNGVQLCGVTSSHINSLTLDQVSELPLYILAQLPTIVIANLPLEHFTTIVNRPDASEILWVEKRLNYLSAKIFEFLNLLNEKMFRTFIATYGEQLSDSQFMELDLDRKIEVFAYASQSSIEKLLLNSPKIIQNLNCDSLAFLLSKKVPSFLPEKFINGVRFEMWEKFNLEQFHEIRLYYLKMIAKLRMWPVWPMYPMYKDAQLKTLTYFLSHPQAHLVKESSNLYRALKATQINQIPEDQLTKIHKTILQHTDPAVYNDLTPSRQEIIRTAALRPDIRKKPRLKINTRVPRN